MHVQQRDCVSVYCHSNRATIRDRVGCGTERNFSNLSFQGLANRRTVVWLLLIIVFPAFLVLPVNAFANGFATATKRRSLTYLRLVPVDETRQTSVAEVLLHQFRSKLPKETRNDYVLGTIEEPDFVELSRLIVEAFGTEVVQIGSDSSAFERMMMAPAVDFLNGSSGLLAFAEVMAGLRSRLRERQATDLQSPDLEGLSEAKQNEIVAKTSLILAVSHQKSLVATVELRLQPCDAKIPFSFPSVDAFERSLAGVFGGDAPKSNLTDFQPYLSNLCVAESQRGRGLGRALVAAVDTITREIWDYDKVYLHVDPENKPALDLYKSEGYVDVGKRWAPFWAGTSSRIGYFVKHVRVPIE